MMTYERPLILKGTIKKVLSQTFPPDKILVVDNSETEDTQELISSLNNPKIAYHRVGYNAGPAMAAKIGLQKLAEEGYQWIYWGDDDDPPVFEDAFEQLFLAISENKNRRVGVVGAVGQYLNRISGNIRRVSNQDLKKESQISVDSIAGGMSMIVSAEVVKLGIFPEEKLFFGFEELDFCLKTKQAGFDLLVPSLLFLRSREKYNRVNYKRPAYVVKEVSSLKRQYYSIRNILWIYRAHRMYFAFLYQLLKNIFKSLYGFRYGISYGKLNFMMVGKGILHGLNHSKYKNGFGQLKDIYSEVEKVN